MKRFKLTAINILFIAIFGYSQTNVTISPDTPHQTIEGWGVSLAWWANLAGGMSQSTINELAGYAVNDLNFNVYRFNIAGGENPNCTEGDHIRKDGGKMPGYRDRQVDNQGWGVNDLTRDFRQIAVMDKIAELREPYSDIITETISYSPPWWMTLGECSAGNVVATTENLKPEFIDDFADYLVSVTADLKNEHANWNIRYIEPFNEPMSGFWRKGGGQEGSGIYPATQAQILWRMWQRQQAYNVADLGLVAADNSKVTTALTNLTTLKNNNPGEYNGIAKVNTHSYGGTWQDKAALATFTKNNGNKPIWQSETGPLSWNLPPGSSNWWIRHYDMAYRLVEDLRNLKTTVWCDWQLMSIDDGWGMVQQTNWDENDPFKEPILKKTRGFYARKNVSTFIKPGYTIVNTSNGNTLGALSADNKEFILVVVNRSNSSTAYNFNLSEFQSVNSFQTYRTSGGDNSSENTTEKTANSISEKGLLNGSTLEYIAPAYSVTTFKIDVRNTLSTSQYDNLSASKVYPNPFTEKTLIKLDRPISNGSLTLYNGLGKELRQIKLDKNIQEITLERAGLPVGVYFYKVIDNTTVKHKGTVVIK